MVPMAGAVVVVCAAAGAGTFISWYECAH